MSRLYGWIAAAFALMGAALLYVSGQRDRAREATEVAKAKAKSTDEARRLEQSIAQAKQEARQQSVEVQREHEVRPADQRPNGSFRR